MKYKCAHCGREFADRCPHNCNTGFRKRHLSFEIVGLTAGDYIRLKAIKTILDADVIPLFDGDMTLREVSERISMALSCCGNISKM